MPAVPPYIIEPIWQQFAALLPEREVDHPLGCHRPRVPDRVVFEKLLQILVFGCAYWRIADEGCSATTLRRRRDEWIEQGAMDTLEELAREAYDGAIGLDPFEVAVDCCITKAPCGGERAGKNPVDRGKGGLKRSVAVDAEGIPLGIVCAPANRHDSPLLSETLDTVEASEAGPLPEGATVHLDRGYDSDATRKRLEERALIGVISEKGKPAPLAATKRWVVERTNSWSTMPTRSWCGAPSARGGSSTSGWPSRTRSSLWAGSFEKPGFATVGRADLLVDHDQLARPLSCYYSPAHPSPSPGSLMPTQRPLCGHRP
jgi:transposase